VADTGNQEPTGMTSNTHYPPRTLRQISGAPTQPAPMAQSVIIVVDAQKEYTEGALPLVGIEQSIDCLAAFLAKARKAHVPVIHVKQVGRPGGPICDPQGPFIDFIYKVRPIAGEPVVEKHLPSSFTQTTLDEELKRIGRKDLIITGYMAHMCLNSTVRAATEAGYRCTIASDLTATRDLPDGKGGVIPAALVKAVHLAGLADRFAIVMERGEDLA
jgi:nicotinamidase-related amidase